MTEPVRLPRKLGLRPNDPDKPRLHLNRLVRTTPDHPIAADLMAGIDFAMDLNDQFGTCVPTGFDNFRRMVTAALTGTQTRASMVDIVTWYRTQNPTFDPDLAEDDPRQEDRGMVIQDFLAWLTKRGIILGFAAIDVRDDEMLKAANYLTMGPINGLDLDEAQVREQYDEGTWDVAGGSAQAGGHCVPTGAYSSKDAAEEDCATWAKRVHMTRTFLDDQRSEAWAVLLPEHVQHPAFREHFDLAAFAAAFTAITGRPFPVTVAPDNPPVPAPPAPAPTPEPGGATFQVAADMAEAIHHWAVRDQMTDDQYLDHFLRRRLRPLRHH